jgi:hypothetical protein
VVKGFALQFTQLPNYPFTKSPRSALPGGKLLFFNRGTIMRMHSIALAAALVFTGLAGNSQQPTAATASSSATATEQITPGTLIQAEIMTDVDAKKARPGDLFRVRLWADVRSGEKIVLPQKTILVGHVVAAQPHTKDNPESTLTIGFDKALLKGGAEIPLRGIVERVQLTPMAASTAAGASRSYNPGLNPANTTNMAMPASGAAAEGSAELTAGPTNTRDTSIAVKPDASSSLTLLTSMTKSDVKLKRLATVDIRITHSGE